MKDIYEEEDRDIRGEQGEIWEQVIKGPSEEKLEELKMGGMPTRINVDSGTHDRSVLLSEQAHRKS